MRVPLAAIAHWHHRKKLQFSALWAFLDQQPVSQLRRAVVDAMRPPDSDVHWALLMKAEICALLASSAPGQALLRLHALVLTHAPLSVQQWIRGI